MAKEIQLTQGKVAIVSDEDYEWLMQWKWSVSNRKKLSYASARIGGACITMHRVIYGRIESLQTEKMVDHINGNGLDNRRENLRLVTRVENARNQGGRGVCGFRGISKDTVTQKWLSAITGQPKKSCPSPVIAAVFANDILRNRDGAFARLNEIPPHVEILARQLPHMVAGRKTKQQEIAQLEHAERVEKAYSEWLIMKRITDWQAAHAATARPSATANESVSEEAA